MVWLGLTFSGDHVIANVDNVLYVREHSERTFVRFVNGEERQADQPFAEVLGLLGEAYEASEEPDE